MVDRRAIVAIAVAALVAAACHRDTSKLDADQEARLAADTIVMRAANLTFHRSRGVGTRVASARDVRASIVVTRHTVLIHESGFVDLLIQGSSRRALDVHRERDRVRINAGSGQSAEVWSFEPPDSADAWTEAIRHVIDGSHTTTR